MRLCIMTAVKDQITNKVDNQSMSKQKLEEISQAQTWKNLKQMEEVDVHGGEIKT